MDSETVVRRPLKVNIDYTRPVDVVDISRGYGNNSRLVSHDVFNHGGPSKSIQKNPWTDQPPASSEGPRPVPQAPYTVLEVPISSSRAVRFWCWPSSPIDSDALQGKIYPNFLQTLKDSLHNHSFSVPSEFPEIEIYNMAAAMGFSPQNCDETNWCMLGDGPFEPSVVLKCSDAPKELVAQCLEFIQREKKLGRWGSNVPALKENLKRKETMFKTQYSYDKMEYRHCITANHAFCCWKQESSGIMWAGVYGMDDMCVVTLSGHLDWKRVRGCLVNLNRMSVLSIFRHCVLSELEDLADPPCKLSEEFEGKFVPPFCVVSEIAAVLDESGQTSSSVAHPDDAVSFVRGSGLLEQAKDSGGAIKLAISAFQRLMGMKFEAEEIEVTVLFGRKFGTGYTRDLDISEIANYLSAV